VVIVRKIGENFVLIRQHDHALVSGYFAANWNQPISPHEATIYAISYHDVGWIDLDQQFLWDEERDRPYDFPHYPLKPKLQAYKQGVSQVETENAYAGFLCSMHYASFFKNVNQELTGEKYQLSVEFYEGELERQQRLQQEFSAQEKEQAQANFKLLQFCDDLSLYLCLNEPQKNDHPWYLHGIEYQGERYHWIWEDENTLRLQPNLFRQPFSIQIPYQIVNRQRQVVEESIYIYRVIL
jgi:Protein of unknown function (DUF3891)